MPEMTPEQVGKEMVRQAIQYVIKTLEPRVMTVQRPIPPVTCVVKYDSSEDNPVTLTLRMPGTPHKADGYDECPLCSGDWHGLTGDGVTGAAGCPGECGSEEEKQRWLESGAPADDVLAHCIGVLAMAKDLWTSTPIKQPLTCAYSRLFIYLSLQHFIDSSVSTRRVQESVPSLVPPWHKDARGRISAPAAVQRRQQRRHPATCRGDTNRKPRPTEAPTTERKNG